MWAAAEDHVEVVKLLIARGADVRATTEEGGFTALTFAARQGALESARSLVAAGADVDALAATTGESLLQVAIKNRHYSIASLLLEHGASANAADKGGRTALHALVTARAPVSRERAPGVEDSSDGLDLMRALLAAGANPDAMTAGLPKLSDALVPSAIRPIIDNAINTGGATPFLLAAQAADVEAMRVLAAGGADPRATTYGGTTALMLAAGLVFVEGSQRFRPESEALEAVRLALELGVDVNAINEHGQTALHGAVYRAANTIIEELARRRRADRPRRRARANAARAGRAGLQPGGERDSPRARRRAAAAARRADGLARLDATGESCHDARAPPCILLCALDRRRPSPRARGAELEDSAEPRRRQRRDSPRLLPDLSQPQAQRRRLDARRARPRLVSAIRRRPGRRSFASCARGRCRRPGKRRPDEAAYDSLASALEASLDRAAAANPNPGRPLLHRMNRAEYANAVRDLLAIDVDTSDLPADDSAYGFDNVADALGVSPLLLESYMTTARKVSRLAIGNASPAPVTTTYKTPEDLTQDYAFAALPLGTRGGIRIDEYLPATGEYEIRVRLRRQPTGQIRGIGEEHRVELAVDGERVELFAVGSEDAYKPLIVNFQNPTQTLSKSFTADEHMHVRLPLAGRRAHHHRRLRRPARGALRGDGAAVPAQLHRGRRAEPARRRVGDASPGRSRRSDAPAETESRRRIFSCHPESPSYELSCATSILGRLARLAYRRPPLPEEMEELLGFYRRGRESSTCVGERLLPAPSRAASSSRCASCSRVPSSCSASSPSPIPAMRCWRRRRDRRRLRRSPTSTSRRGSRSSSGAASPTPSCSTLRRPAV